MKSIFNKMTVRRVTDSPSPVAAVITDVKVSIFWPVTDVCFWSLLAGVQKKHP